MNLRKLLSATSLSIALVAPLSATSFADSNSNSEVAGNIQATESPALDKLNARFVAWQSHYGQLTKTAATAIASSKPENFASQLFLLERSLVSMLSEAATLSEPNKVRVAHQESALTSSIRAQLSQLQWNYQSLQETMRARTEARKPGSSGATLATRERDSQGSVDTFAPGFLQTKPLPQAERDAKVLKLTAEHRAKFPSQPLFFDLNQNSVQGIGNLALVEWVKMPEKHGGQIRLTLNAKHAVTATGSDTNSAGSLKILWHPNFPSVPEKALAVFVSNWSGTYQPNIASLESTMLAKLRDLGFRQDSVVLTTTMPLEPKLYEILLSFRKDKAQVKDSVTRLLARANRIAPHSMSQNQKADLESRPKGPLFPNRHLLTVGTKIRPGSRATLRHTTATTLSVPKKTHKSSVVRSVLPARVR